MKKKKFNKKQISKCYDSRSFYRSLKMDYLFENEEIINISQMRINSKTFQMIEDIIKKNWKMVKNVSGLSEKIIKRNQLYDIIQFMPKVDDNVEDWTIEWDSIDEMNRKAKLK